MLLILQPGFRPPHFLMPKEVHLDSQRRVCGLHFWNAGVQYTLGIQIEFTRTKVPFSHPKGGKSYQRTQELGYVFRGTRSRSSLAIRERINEPQRRFFNNVRTGFLTVSDNKILKIAVKK